MTSARPVLTARGIHKRFGGVTALADVTLEILPGEVHCLAGENGCGKSTLIKVISGVEAPDAGEITIDGHTYSRLTPRDAIRAGVQVIYQDFSLFPNLTVAENIVLTAQIAQGRRTVNPRETVRRAREVVDRLGVRLDVHARVEDLTVADKQLTAICRALAENAKVIFMDEPTTALTWREVRALFRVVRSLREHGVAMVFVSHKLDEVLEISQRVTVLRNGRQAAAGPVEEFDRRTLARAMTGREIREERLVQPIDEAAAPVLEVRGLTLDGAVADVSFAVRPGEILGITGLLGSGRTEIAETIFGVTPATGGQILVDGRPVQIRSIQDAVAAGIGYVPSDRLSQGLFLDQPIARNVMAASLDLHRGRVGLLDRPKVQQTIQRLFTGLRIKAPSTAAPVRSLSGGNQQRVVLARWLARSPRVLILNSPTVGVDVNSKSEILDILRAESATGMGIVIISDDVPELVSVCHRVLVVNAGRVQAELSGDHLTEAHIMKGFDTKGPAE